MTTETPAAPAASQIQTSFADLALCEPIQRALREKNYTHPSPIQAQAIPILLEGHDLVGCAQTGTGKTAAFALPILHRLAASPKPAGRNRMRVLILTPTRELAGQIGQSFAAYGKHLNLTHTVLFGGVGFGNQIRAMQRGVDVVIATPGRLLDLAQQGHVRFDGIEIFVLDEADRMLDMGFVHDVKRIQAQIPAKRQSLLFSATMPPAIQEMVNKMLNHPRKVEVAPVSSTAERVEQRLCFVDRGDKLPLLQHVLKENAEGLVLVFVRMKHAANRLVEQLGHGGVMAEAIHGNKSQGARERALANFRSGKTRVLVATDIAARGIDVKGVALVVNFDLPEEPESYVHRIGRTARAGAEGLAISFCDRAERGLLRDIERVIRRTVRVVKDHPYAKEERDLAPAEPIQRGGGGRGMRPRGFGGGRPGGQGRSRFGGGRSGRN
ncbi:MAG: DEAD/DEAH box helicase [Verrucomicrobium sp.]|nr:DEAD/DEAH box helicase [Verrucomicrobium sp.]